jgi:hypothetical protein
LLDNSEAENGFGEDNAGEGLRIGGCIGESLQEKECVLGENRRDL